MVACLLPGRSGLQAQIPEPVTLEAPPPPVIDTVSKADEFSQIELRESYLRVQEQLRQTQQSIVTNRLESEAIAMTQSFRGKARHHPIAYGRGTPAPAGVVRPRRI